MPKPLDRRSQNILEFRPQIGFVEPEVQPGVITPIQEVPQLQEAYDQVDEVQKLANAVNILATAAQASVDEIAKNIKMAVLPEDEQVLQAMERLFPGQDPTTITYQQYRSCKDRIMKEGISISKQLEIKPEDISKYKDDAQKALNNELSSSVTQMGGFGTPESKDGRLDPAKNPKGRIIKPLNYANLQVEMLGALANLLWKNFILPSFAIKVAGVSVRPLLPKKVYHGKLSIELPRIDKMIKQAATSFKKAAKDSKAKPKKKEE